MTTSTDVRDVLRILGSGETARPRIVHYGPDGRIELSGRVLLNWVAKAANLLQEEFDAAPGTRVGLDLPAGHWRTAYWALAAWTLGATVVTGVSADVDVLVTSDDPADAAHAALVVVTLAPLARRAAGPLPGGALDEAAELAGFGDVVVPFESAQPEDPALVAFAAPGAAAQTWTFATVAGPPPRGRRLLLTPAGEDAAATLRRQLGAWAADGSVVVVDDASADAERIASDEGVDAT